MEIERLLDEEGHSVIRIPSDPIQNESMLQNTLLPVITEVLYEFAPLRCVPRLIGNEIGTGHGRIDILLQDLRLGTLLPIELKMGTAKPSIIEQLNRYSLDIASIFDNMVLKASFESDKNAEDDDAFLTWKYVNANLDILTYPVVIAEKFDPRLYLTRFKLIKWEYADFYLYLRQVFPPQLPIRAASPLLEMAVHDFIKITSGDLKAKNIISSTFPSWLPY